MGIESRSVIQAVSYLFSSSIFEGLCLPPGANSRRKVQSELELWWRARPKISLQPQMVLSLIRPSPFPGEGEKTPDMQVQVTKLILCLLWHWELALTKPSIARYPITPNYEWMNPGRISISRVPLDPFLLQNSIPLDLDGRPITTMPCLSVLQDLAGCSWKPNNLPWHASAFIFCSLLNCLLFCSWRLIQNFWGPC